MLGHRKRSRNLQSPHPQGTPFHIPLPGYRGLVGGGSSLVCHRNLYGFRVHNKPNCDAEDSKASLSMHGYAGEGGKYKGRIGVCLLFVPAVRVKSEI